MFSVQSAFDAQRRTVSLPVQESVAEMSVLHWLPAEHAVDAPLTEQLPGEPVTLRVPQQTSFLPPSHCAGEMHVMLSATSVAASVAPVSVPPSVVPVSVPVSGLDVSFATSPPVAS